MDGWTKGLSLSRPARSKCYGDAVDLLADLLGEMLLYNTLIYCNSLIDNRHEWMLVVMRRHEEFLGLVVRNPIHNSSNAGQHKSSFLFRLSLSF